MIWNYALLSMKAKEAGGPEELLSLIEEKSRMIGFSQGRSSMYPWLGASGAVVVVLSTILIVREIKNKNKLKEALAKNEIAYAKENLIQEIRAHERSFQNEKACI
ncbi:MAG: hypothetical protein J5586_01350 [Clostridia bacterium]|nr:hypothetical protein [Clostridia bacterium]